MNRLTPLRSHAVTLSGAGNGSTSDGARRLSLVRPAGTAPAGRLELSACSVQCAVIVIEPVRESLAL